MESLDTCQGASRRLSSKTPEAESSFYSKKLLKEHKSMWRISMWRIQPDWPAAGAIDGQDTDSV